MVKLPKAEKTLEEILREERKSVKGKNSLEICLFVQIPRGEI